MATLTALQESQRTALVSAAEQVPDVLAVVLDANREALWIACKPECDIGAMRAAVRGAVSRAGLHPDAVDIRLVSDALPKYHRRVRLVEVTRVERADGRIGVRATLEWKDQTFTGEAAGERAAPIELRTAALAGLNAVAEVIGEDLGLRLIGVKQLHAFDANLVVASIVRTRTPAQHLVGSVLQTDDPLRAAVAAVLHALNRLLGNYLTIPE